MCEYCKLKSTGIMDEMESNATLIKVQDGSSIFSVDMYRSIVESGNQRTNELWFMYDVLSNNQAMEVVNSSIKIKYCPFCGEEL